MTAVLDYPVKARQLLDILQVQGEARTLYSESDENQTQIAGAIGTTQSAVSAALNADADTVTNHTGVLVRMVNYLSPTHEIERVEKVEFRVKRKGADPTP